MLTEAFFKTVKTCSPLKTEERCKPNSFKKDRGKIFKDGKDMLTEASTTQAWEMRRCGTVHQCFHHASMEDAIVTKTKEF